MLDVLIWWLVLELIGIAILPIAFRFFRCLPDRGYAFYKPLGLLLIAYPFWLLTVFGFLTNTRGAIVVVAVIVAGLSWWIGTRPPITLALAGSAGVIPEAKQNGTDDDRPPEDQLSSIVPPLSLVVWLRENKSTIIVTELVFMVAFAAWVIVRAYMPEITATEKPMEFAFLNGVLQSEHFPPVDPWLSGYAISYYHFGYIIAAMLTMLTGVVPSVAFNLMIASLFALAATGAFGLVYNLIRLSPLAPRNLRTLGYALCAPVFLVLIGNLEGFFESLHARGWGPPEFWQWLDVKGLAQAPVIGVGIPGDNWWWWRASRVIHDVVNGQTQEVIDEFPQFSFLLGDMHPHVLALPFVLLALAVALNLLDSKFEIQNSKLIRLAGFELRLLPSSFLLLPLLLGGLFFLNSWDILPYGFILVAAFVIARYRLQNQWDNAAWRDTIVFVGSLGVLSVLLYLPFFVGFQSQAGGVLPTLFVKTKLHQYLLMFGLFVFILAVFLARLLIEKRSIRPGEWLNRVAPALTTLVLFPLVVALLALIVLAANPYLQDQARAVVPSASGNLLLTLLGAYILPLISDPWLFLILVFVLAGIVVLAREYFDDVTTTFVLLMAFTAFLLTFGVEFVYLRDQFGSRMNTVFKFYFQAWTLLAIAAAYAVFYLSQRLRGVARGVWLIGLTLLLGMSMFYPALAIPNRADDFDKPPTLDGLEWIRNYAPGDYAAMQWLLANAPRGSHVLEAVADQEYSYDNRISMATGFPTVLGWGGHESQWRGNSNLFKNDAAGIDRAADVKRIYQTLDARESLTLLDKYAINFVVVGALEKSQYGLSKSQIDKFGKIMSQVFENNDVRIYGRIH